MASSEIPKYLSISNDLRERLGRLEFQPGERLPAQHAMADHYGVTVMTLRQALSELEGEGLIHASKGKGTFVSEPPNVRYDLDHLSSFTQEMAEQGLAVTTTVVAASPNSDDAAARSELKLSDDAHLIELVRVRSVGAERIVLQRSYFDQSLWPSISSLDFATQSLYGALASTRGLVIDRASEVIRAVGLNAADADLLRSEPGAPVLESVRVSRTADGVAFLYDRALLSGSATEIRTERSNSGTRLAFQAV